MNTEITKLFRKLPRMDAGVVGPDRFDFRRSACSERVFGPWSIYLSAAGACVRPQGVTGDPMLQMTKGRKADAAQELPPSYRGIFPVL